MPPRALSSNPSPARPRLTAVVDHERTQSRRSLLGTADAKNNIVARRDPRQSRKRGAAGGAPSSPMASPAMPADSLAALDSDGSPRHLVVDALNLLTDYFIPDFRGASKGDAWTMLAVLRRRVAGFLEACANTTPAMGALNPAAIAPATPQPINTSVVRTPPVACRRKLPIVAPKCTSGPYCPTDAPPLAEMKAASVEPNPARTSSSLSVRCAA